MPGNKLILYLAMVLFGAIILLGEAFKLNFGLGKVSLTLLIIGCTAILCLGRGIRFYKGLLDKLVYLYAAIFLAFALVGKVAGNALADIFEDLYPVVSFVVLYIIWRSLETEYIHRLWKVILVLSVLAALKVLIINFVPFEVLWDNGWQAAKEALPIDGVYRIILRGGDVFLSFALVYFIIDVQRKKSSSIGRNFLFICLMVLAVFLSMSRSSFLADGLALIFTFLLFKRFFSTKKLLVFLFGISTILIILLPFFNTIALAASIFEARTEAFDVDNFSVEFRKDEKSLIYNKASSVYYMGNGLGSYFYLANSGSEKKDQRSIYAHDYNSWLILKTGIIGLAVFYSIFIVSCYNMFWCLRQKNHMLNDRYHLIILTLFASGIVVWVISFLANKLSTISGSVFFAFFAASSVIFKKKYENSV